MMHINTLLGVTGVKEYCQYCKQPKQDGVELKRLTTRALQVRSLLWGRVPTSRKDDVPEFVAARKRIDFGSPAYTSAMQAANAAGNMEEKANLQCAAMCAVRFVEVCEQDILPTDETEERIWGLWGNPQSPSYTRLLLLYQKALKNGDPTAQKLMEALLQKPHASQALTQTLSNVRYAMTEDDTLDDVMRIWDRYTQWLGDMQIRSEFDRWPLPEFFERGRSQACSAASAQLR